MTHGTILLVDDEVKIRRALGSALRDERHEVVEAGGALEAQRLLAQQPFDVLVIDNRMPEMSGLDLIRELSSSVEAGERREEFNHYGIVGRSGLMQDVIRKAELVAESKSTVLIAGETGTGKEMVARAIHDRSAQRDMPLIKVNCATIPKTLLESELFGHRRGAFTGATANKKGKFELADGGTIFLGEISSMSSGLQLKVLRVLQEREFEPLGSERSHRVDVRVIAATNKDLKQLVAEGRFAEDSYYRLNVIPIAIPPLRERREDIPVLVDHFLRKHAKRAGKQIERIEDAAL